MVSSGKFYVQLSSRVSANFAFTTTGNFTMGLYPGLAVIGPILTQMLWRSAGHCECL